MESRESEICQDTDINNADIAYGNAYKNQRDSAMIELPCINQVLKDNVGKQLKKTSSAIHSQEQQSDKKYFIKFPSQIKRKQRTLCWPIYFSESY